MNWNALSYTIPLWITLIFSIIISVYIFKRRIVPGATALFVMSLIMGLWSLGYIFELLSPNLSEKIFWDNIQMLGGALGSSCFAFALQYTKQELYLKRKIWILLVIEPVIMWSLAVLNLTGLFRDNAYLYTEGTLTVLIYDVGIASWIDFIYGYVMYILFIILLIKFFISSHTLFRKQLATIISGLTITAGGYILFFLDLTPKYMRDPTPFTFTILNLCIFFSIYRYRLLNIVPIAREILFEKINAGILVLDISNKIVDINILAQNIFNVKINKAIGQPIDNIFYDFKGILKELDELKQKKLEICQRKNDEECIYEVEILPLFNKKNIYNGWLIVINDITKNRKLERALQASEEKYRNVSELANDGIAIVQDGYAKYVNKKILDMINYSYQEIVNNPFYKFIVQEFRENVKENYKARLSGDSVGNRYESALLCKNGEKLYVEVNAAVMNYDGRPAILAYIRDITERKQAEKDLKDLAEKDPLTHILNRRQFFMLAQKKFEQCTKYKYSMCAIMIDIDHFKKVNDNYGHAIGDKVLCSVANAIVDSLKDSGVACRYGGEEFAVFLTETDIYKAKLIAETIRKDIMNSSVNTHKGEILVTVSLGVSKILNFDKDSVDKLFDRADQALYIAKQAGRNRVKVYET
ncbi:diguanylate cyclase [Clostridium aestuarii]|uniref:Diguanylate cyclase n=1 Tax=Clostridium aestuarii TaxID=338193 RepID=A0ABT4CYS1_9CLOT|nr:diguanylate cyclase [Clostridium aestuarii]MCY6484123.1 diguanylate cyclase [Clostridium aestuarii]